MTMSNTLRGAALILAGLALSGCEISDPRLNTGLSIGPDGVSMQPSVQANVGGGLLQYTPPMK
ncbi:MAG: hypothetical protein U5N55_00045 [Cypionkella sp.]|nr:hypothetical protein [Cypionkella sp.]